MELIKKRTQPIDEQIELENAKAKTAQIEAKLEYLAMMADIDIEPEEGAEVE